VDHTAVEQILSLLAIVGLVAVALIWIGALLEKAGVGSVGSRVAATLDGAEVPLALVVALTATAGSLYLSESVGYIPCVLCWFQRIVMYPLVIVLAVAVLRRERVVAPYVVAVAAAGVTVSIYHYQLEWFPDQASVCSTTASVPCSVVWFRHFGVSSIPFLAGTAFLLIGTLLALAWHNERALAAGAGDGEPAEAQGDQVPAAPGRGLLASLAAMVALGAVAAGIAIFALAGHDDASSTDDEPTTTDPGDATAGKLVFAEAGCGGCHVFTPAGTTGTAGPSLDATTLDAADIREVVSEGRGAMQGFAAQLDPDEIDQVAAFVASG
jgi:disulfide bond formation protein DsbB